jgi:hypothetical protein
MSVGLGRTNSAAYGVLGCARYLLDGYPFSGHFDAIATSAIPQIEGPKQDFLAKRCRGTAEA